MAVATVPVPFSSGDSVEWLKCFEICSKANKWSAETQALKLPTLLNGDSLAIQLELSQAEQADIMVKTKKKLR